MKRKDILLSQVSVPPISSLILKSHVPHEQVIHMETGHEAAIRDFSASIEKKLLEKLPPEDAKALLSEIEDYASHRESLHFICGFRAGAKLLNELVNG